MANILVVEDNLIMQKVAETILKKEGHHVTIAKDGQEAVTHLDNHSNQYDLVITDIMLPFVSGYEIVTKVKKQFATTPVIIVSSVGDDEGIQKGLGIGADDYITKPIIAGDLLPRVQKLLGKS